MQRKTIIKIKRIAFTKQRKIEVFALYNQVVDTISKYDTKAMKIDATCEALLGMQAKSNLLNVSDKDRGPNLLTPVLDKLHERRLQLAGLITNQIRVLEKAAFKGTDHLIKISKVVVLEHFNYLRESSRIDVTQLIIQFFDELNDKPEVKEALTELGIQPFLDELQVTQREYEVTYSERLGENSRRPKGSTLPVQREIQYILKILFEQVDYYQHVYKEVDYSDLISTLNYVIATYTKLIKTRDTQRKNKKLKANDKAQAALVENQKNDTIDKNEPSTVADTTKPEPTKDVKEEQKNSPPVNKSNTKDKGKPITGLLDILKKPDIGRGNNSSDESLPPTSGD
jgi:hypothetical protein